jgi:hypothetical protein
MKFRDWLMNETRFKGLQRMYQSRFREPDQPDGKRGRYTTPPFVVNQMYKATISPKFEKAFGSALSHNASSTPTTPASTVATADSQDQSLVRSPSSLINDNDKIGNAKFMKKPIVVDLHPLNLDGASLGRIVHFRFGLSPDDERISNDTQRYTTQRQLALSRGEGGNEPIVLIKHNENEYEIIDGYHRVANYLLQGAPPEEQALVQSGDFISINFDKWKPVKMMAYVGVPRSHPQLPSQSYPQAPMPIADPEATVVNMPFTPSGLVA